MKQKMRIFTIQLDLLLTNLKGRALLQNQEHLQSCPSK